MKILSIGNKEYTLEYTFKAAEHSKTVQKVFDVVSGAYILKQVQKVSDKEKGLTDAMLNGTSEMVGDIPNIVRTCFYSGLLENHSITEDASYELMKAYMKEHKVSFKKLFEDIKECMAEDGFLELSGITEMLEEMNSKMATPNKEEK